MKEEIQKDFQFDRSYQGGVSLYMKYGNRIGLKRQLNVQTESNHMLEILHEELRIIAGIDACSFRRIMLAPVGKPAVVPDPRLRPVKNRPAGRIKAKKKTSAPAKDNQKAKKTGSAKTSPKQTPIKEKDQTKENG